MTERVVHDAVGLQAGHERARRRCGMDVVARLLERPQLRADEELEADVARGHVQEARHAACSVGTDPTRYRRRVSNGAVKGATRAVAKAVDRLHPPRAGLTILIYHRVGGRTSTTVDLPTAQFAEQLSFLVEHCHVVSLDDAADLLAPVRPRTMADPWWPSRSTTARPTSSTTPCR